MSKTRRFTSEQTEIIETKPNPFIEGDWWRFTVSLPRVQSLAFGGSAGFGMLFFLYSMVLLEKIPENRFIFLVIAGTLAGCVSLFTFFIISIDHSKQIRKGEEKHTTTTPVLFEENEPEPTPDSPPIVGNRRPYVYFPVGDDFKPLTTEQRTFFSRYSVGQSVVREDLQNSPAYKNKGLNLSVNYPAFVERLKEAGILDANNSLTTFGVEWAKGE